MEADLILMASEYQNRVWSLTVWFTSISMTLIAVAHFVGRSISLKEIVFIEIGYLGFLFNFFRHQVRLTGNIQSVIADLEKMESDGEPLSTISLQLIQNYELPTSLISISAFIIEGLWFIFLAISVSIYFVVQFRKGKKSEIET